MKKSLFAVAIVLFFFQVSFAQVYKWIDEKGVAHFTDDYTQVPEKYRSRSEKIGMSEERGEAKADAENNPKKREETYKDRMGRGEAYWKGQVEQWRARLNDLQHKLDALRAKYNGLTERFNASRNTAERGSLRGERDQVKNEMDACKAEMEEANGMLEKKIPEEAELNKAKSEWIK